MHYLNKATLLEINHQVIKRAGKGLFAVQHPEGLEIITQQPKQIVFGRELYPTVWLKAAFILQKITKNHIFADGNKRTAIIAAAFSLFKNGYELSFSEDEGNKLILYVTISDNTEQIMKFIADWLKEYSVPKV